MLTPEGTVRWALSNLQAAREELIGLAGGCAADCRMPMMISMVSRALAQVAGVSRIRTLRRCTMRKGFSRHRNGLTRVDCRRKPLLDLKEWLAIGRELSLS